MTYLHETNQARQDKAKGVEAVQALLVPSHDSRFFKTLWGRLVEERGADLPSLAGTVRAIGWKGGDLLACISPFYHALPPRA